MPSFLHLRVSKPKNRAVLAVTMGLLACPIVSATAPIQNQAPAQNQSGAPKDPLALNSFLQLVDRYYPKLNGIRVERDIADAKEQEKRGAFDPVFSSGTDWIGFNSSSSRGKRSNTQMTETVVELLDRSGIKLSGGQRFGFGSVKSPFSSTGDLGELFLSAKVPLIRDLGINPKSVAERQARFGQSLADQVVREFRFLTFNDAGSAYWQWVGAGVKLKIAQDLLRVAEQRLVFITTQFEEGIRPKIDVAEARAEVFRRKGSLEKSERDLQKAELKLSLYLWSEDGRPLGIPQRTALATLPEQSAALSDEAIQNGIDLALQNRPELSAITVSREIVDLDLALARNERKPALDFAFGPGYDFGADGIGSTYKVGLFYSIPLRQNTADGKIAQAQAKQRKLQLELDQVTLNVQTEVRDAASEYNQTYLRLLAAQEELAAARELERGELDRFEEGIGTLFLVNQRERARAEAETKLVDTRVELEIARLGFLATTAQLNP